MNYHEKVDGELEADLPAIALVASGDLADPAEIHSVVAVDPRKTVRFPGGAQFAQVEDVAERPLAVGPDAGVVSVCLESTFLQSRFH